MTRLYRIIDVYCSLASRIVVIY